MTTVNKHTINNRGSATGGPLLNMLGTNNNGGNSNNQLSAAKLRMTEDATCMNEIKED
jgi:hypothetical protein